MKTTKFSLILILAILLTSLEVIGGPPEPRDQHYGFAHRTLVGAMRNGPEFLAKLEKDGNEYLEELWDTAGGAARFGKKPT